jgi:ElaB/YqjD/DUF883 family membrane-anchored ribosome-binding protein
LRREAERIEEQQQQDDDDRDRDREQRERDPDVFVEGLGPGPEPEDDTEPAEAPPGVSRAVEQTPEAAPDPELETGLGEPQDPVTQPEPTEQAPQAEDEAVFRERIRAENPGARNIEISSENGQLEATFESPGQEAGPVTGAARGFVSELSGIDLPTESEFVAGVTRNIEDVTGVSVPTERELVLESREAASDLFGVEVPGEEQLASDLRVAVAESTDIDLPAEQDLAESIRGGVAERTGVSPQSLEDPADVIAATAPVAVAEPTPLGEVAVGGLALGAGVVEAGDVLTTRATDAPTETVRDRPEVPIENFGRPDELRVPPEAFEDGFSIPEGVAEDDVGIQVPQDSEGFGIEDGEIVTPDDFTGGGVIRAGGVVGEQIEEPLEEEFEDDDIIIDIPEQFIPEEQVVIGEEPGELEEVDREQAQESFIDRDGFMDERLQRLREQVVDETVRQEAEQTDLDVGTETVTNQEFQTAGVGAGVGVFLEGIVDVDEQTTTQTETQVDTPTDLDFPSPPDFVFDTPGTTTTENVPETPTVTQTPTVMEPTELLQGPTGRTPSTPPRRFPFLPGLETEEPGLAEPDFEGVRAVEARLVERELDVE